MPLKPNFIERFVINNGMVPGVMIDMGLPMFQLFAMLGAMEIGFFRHLKDEPADIKTLAKRLNASEICKSNSRTGRVKPVSLCRGKGPRF